MKLAFVFEIDRGQWLNANQRLHPLAHASRTGSLFDYAYRLALFPKRGAIADKDGRPIAIATWAAGEPKREPPFFDAEHPAMLTVFVGWPTARPSDSDNAFPTVKALVDGIGKGTRAKPGAGLLSDDDDTVIHQRTYRRGPRPARKGFYEISLVLQDCLCLECLKRRDRAERGEP